MRGLAGETGTAAVEMAILCPAVLALFTALVFLGDLGVARVRQREAVRLATWELTTHPLSDERDGSHAARFAAARRQAEGATRRHFAGGLSTGLLARGKLGPIEMAPVGLEGGQRLQRPTIPSGFGGLLEHLGSLLQRVGGLQLPLLERQRFNTGHVGAQVAVGLSIEGSGLLPGLPARLSPAPARLELRVDTWALDEGDDVPLPGTGTALGRQVGRIALFGIAERLGGPRAGEALSWVPFTPSTPVVSMNYGTTASDRSPVSCGGDDPLARSGRWENGPRAGTKRDRISPARCFDTLPIDANGFGAGGGRRSDPVWRQLQRRGPWELGCDRPGVPFPAGCGGGGGPWAAAASR